MNRILEQYLCFFVHSQLANWFRYLALAKWSYNTSLYTSSGFTPFEVLYSKPLPTLPHYILGTTNNEAVETLVTGRQEIHTKLQQRLLKA